MNSFTALADARWRRGIREYRRSRDAPFAGDPVKEAIEECLDLRNYAKEAGRQGRLTEECAAIIVTSAEMVFELLVDNSRQPKVQIGPWMPVQTGGADDG